jgi:hypothetical protein
MNADAAPMNADTPHEVFVPGTIDPRNEATDTPQGLYPLLSALHRRSSAFPKILASVSHPNPVSASHK